MIPDGWRATTLGTLVDSPLGLVSGPSGSQLAASEYVEDGIPVIMPRDFPDGTVDSCRAARITPEKAAALARYRLCPGDVLLARRGEIGRSALITAAEDGWICGTGCLRLRPDSAAVDSTFLLERLRWPPAVRWLRRGAVGQTQLKNLSQRVLSALPLQLPPLAQQRQISSAACSIDRSIRLGRQMRDRADRIRQAAMAKLLVQGVGCSRTRRTVLGKIPRSWQVQPLRELCTLTDGNNFKAAEQTPDGWAVVRIRNLRGSDDFKYFTGQPRPEWIIETGELLFAWAGVRGVSFGPYLWNGPRALLNQHIFRVRPHEGIDKTWLFEVLQRITRQLERKTRGFKEKLQHLRKADLTEHLVPVPPTEEQRALGGRAAQLTEPVRLREALLEHTARIRRGVLDGLLSGRLRL